jgi:hypothetical protein
VFAPRDVDAREQRTAHAAEVLRTILIREWQMGEGMVEVPEMVEGVRWRAAMVARAVELGTAPPELLAQEDEIETVWRWMQWVRPHDLEPERCD